MKRQKREPLTKEAVLLGVVLVAMSCLLTAGAVLVY